MATAGEGAPCPLEGRDTPANMVRWIQHPREIEHGTAMPDMGVTDSDARDIAAYLYTLHAALSPEPLIIRAPDCVIRAPKRHMRSAVLCFQQLKSVANGS